MPKKSLHLSDRAAELLERLAEERCITQARTVELALDRLASEPGWNQEGSRVEPSGTTCETRQDVVSALVDQLAAKDSQIADLTATLRSMAECERARAVSNASLLALSGPVERRGVLDSMRSYFRRHAKRGEDQTS